jgi:arylsulfatase A-like enzyme/Flp pilus assembly protein TadD
VRKQKAKSRKQKWLIAFLLPAAFCLLTCSAREARTYNVLLITLDTFRADRVGPLTPNLSKLAVDAARFRAAESPVPLTLPAHATILSGVLPLHHGVRANGAGSFSGETLATALSRQGWRSAAFVGAFVLDRRFGLNRGFEVYDDAITRDPNDDSTSNLEARRRGGEVVDAALKWLASGRDRKPFFAWVHLYDAHAPYAPPAPFPQTYDGGIAYVDAQVGRLLAGVDRRSTVVAIVGDHGEALGEHGELTHGLLLYEPTLHVPMILSAPGVPAREVAEPVSTADLASTVASLAGATFATKDGRDLTADLRAGRDPKRADVYGESEYARSFGWAGLTAMRRGSLKLISGGAPELYDAVADPGESNNLLADRRRDYRELQQASDAIRLTAVTASATAVDAETRAKLASLGYVAPAAGSAAGAARDPKAMLPLFLDYERAMVALNGNRPAAALPLLEAAVATDPANRLFRATLGRTQRDLGNLDKAVSLYREAVALAPGEADAWYDLAATLQDAGEYDEARMALVEVLKREPNRPEAHNALGVSYASRGDFQHAVAEFRKALDIDPRNARAWNNLGNVMRDGGRADDAAQSFRRASDLAPRYPDPLNGLGVVLVQKGRPRDAVPLFDAALALAPRYYEAQLNRGIALQMSGDAAAASAQFRSLLAGLPAGARYDAQRNGARTLLKALH